MHSRTGKTKSNFRSAIDKVWVGEFSLSERMQPSSKPSDTSVSPYSEETPPVLSGMVFDRSTDYGAAQGSGLRLTYRQPNQSKFPGSLSHLRSCLTRFFCTSSTAAVLRQRPAVAELYQAVRIGRMK